MSIQANTKTGISRLKLRLEILGLKRRYLQLECRYGELVDPFFKRSALRFVLVRFYLFAYGKDVPPNFRWGCLFRDEPAGSCAERNDQANAGKSK